MPPRPDREDALDDDSRRRRRGRRRDRRNRSHPARHRGTDPRHPAGARRRHRRPVRRRDATRDAGRDRLPRQGSPLRSRGRGTRRVPAPTGDRRRGLTHAQYDTVDRGARLGHVRAAAARPLRRRPGDGLVRARASTRGRGSPGELTRESSSAGQIDRRSTWAAGWSGGPPVIPSGRPVRPFRREPEHLRVSRIPPGGTAPRAARRVGTRRRPSAACPAGRTRSWEC